MIQIVMLIQWNTIHLSYLKLPPGEQFNHRTIRMSNMIKIVKLIQYNATSE